MDIPVWLCVWGGLYYTIVFEYLWGCTYASPKDGHSISFVLASIQHSQQKYIGDLDIPAVCTLFVFSFAY